MYEMTPDISFDTLQAICSMHGLGKIDHMTEPAQGNINRTVIVNDAYVLRFDILDWGGANRYAGEKWAYDLLRDSDVPVPYVVALDTTRTLVSCDYLILTKMPGRVISGSVTDLTAESRHAIVHAAGRCLATMHSNTFSQVGLLHRLAAGAPEPDWETYVAGFFRYYQGQVGALGILPAGMLKRTDALLVRMKPLVSTVRVGSLIHGDYHLENLLQEDGRLSAVVDFDWVASGDPSWDFRIDDQIEQAIPGGRAVFYAGYTSRRSLPDGHWQRVSLYRIGLHLDHLEMRVTDKRAIARITGQLMREIDWLESHL